MSPKPTYNSVKEFFEKEYAHLVTALDRESDFWVKVKNNSFSNDRIAALLEEDRGVNSGYTHDATKALQQGRIQGKINNPG